MIAVSHVAATLAYAVAFVAIWWPCQVLFTALANRRRFYRSNAARRLRRLSERTDR